MGGEGGTPCDVVLVGPLPHGPRQLDVVKAQGFYHIPVAAIPPERLPVDYVALYEPAGAFGHPQGFIRYYARVLGTQTVARRELPVLPWAGRGRPTDRYYRLDLEPLAELGSPVVNAGGGRVGFRYTRLAALLRARVVEQLALFHVAEQSLWAALEEAGIPFRIEVAGYRGRGTERAPLVLFRIRGPRGELSVRYDHAGGFRPAGGHGGRWLSPEDMPMAVADPTDLVQALRSG